MSVSPESSLVLRAQLLVHGAPPNRTVTPKCGDCGGVECFSRLEVAAYNGGNAAVRIGRVYSIKHIAILGRGAV